MTDQNKRILALDVGTKTCGVAATDPMGIICQPLTTLRYKGDHDVLRVFKDLKDVFIEYQPQTIVLGLPLNEDGSESLQAKKIRGFVKGLQKHLKGNQVSPDNFKWVFFDEFYSSKEAESFLIEADVSRKKRKQVIDKMAAVFILQRYLEDQGTS